MGRNSMSCASKESGRNSMSCESKESTHILPEESLSMILPAESAHILESEYFFDDIRGSEHFAHFKPRLEVHSNHSNFAISANSLDVHSNIFS